MTSLLGWQPAVFKIENERGQNLGLGAKVENHLISKMVCNFTTKARIVKSLLVSKGSPDFSLGNLLGDLGSIF